MMDLEQVSAHLSALEGVHQGEQGGRLRWTVRGRLVARQLDDEALVIRSGFTERERLIAEHPETFTVAPRFEAHLMVVAELASACPAAVRDALDPLAALDVPADDRSRLTTLTP